MGDSFDLGDGKIPVGRVVPTFISSSRSKEVRSVFGYVWSLFAWPALVLAIARGLAEAPHWYKADLVSISSWVFGTADWPDPGILRSFDVSSASNVALGLAAAYGALRSIAVRKRALLWFEKTSDTTGQVKIGWIQPTYTARFVWQYVTAIWRGQQMNPWHSKSEVFSAATNCVHSAGTGGSKLKIVFQTPTNILLASQHIAVDCMIGGISLLLAWQSWRVPLAGYVLRGIFLNHACSVLGHALRLCFNFCDIKYQDSAPGKVTYRFVNFDDPRIHVGHAWNPFNY